MGTQLCQLRADTWRRRGAAPRQGLEGIAADFLVTTVLQHTHGETLVGWRPELIDDGPFEKAIREAQLPRGVCDAIARRDDDEGDQRGERRQHHNAR